MSDWTLDEPELPRNGREAELAFQAEELHAEAFPEAAAIAGDPCVDGVGPADMTSTGVVDWPSTPSLQAFFDRTSGPIEWLWDGMIMRGSVNILGAYMKVGKSTFIMNVLRGLVEQKRFLDRDMHVSDEGKVFWFAPEDSERIIRYNFDHAAITPHHYAKKLVLVTKGSPYIDALRADGNPDVKWQSFLAALKRDRCEVIILDTINTFSAYMGLDDENDNQKVTKLMDRIAELKGCGITVIITQHTGKNGDRGGTLQSLRGASAYAALADQIMLLTYPGSDNTTTKRKLVVIGRTSVDSPPFINLDYDKSSATYFAIADDAPMTAGESPEATLDALEHGLRNAPREHYSQTKLRGLKLARVSTQALKEAFDELRDRDGAYGCLRLDDKGYVFFVDDPE